MKHTVNKNITYRGLNAREVKEAQKVETDRWKKVRDDYNLWVKQMRVWNNPALIICAIIGAVVAVGYMSVWTKVIGFIMVYYPVTELYKRAGHKEGYFDGYETGMSDGVDKMLGIDEEESADIHERAMEMEIDERVIRRLDKKDSE